ncbi:MAG: radical SAM protein [Candidatus Omnitrophota bacterium]
MKVYLVNPPASSGRKIVREGRCMQRKGAWTTVWPPVTLATMGAMLLESGVQVKLSDCIVENITHRGLKEKISAFCPDLLVINTATTSIDSDLWCAESAKEVSAGVKTLAFGLHVTMLADEAFLKQPSLDFVIRGEPEFCLDELAGVLKQEGEHDLTGINGLSYRQGLKIIHNPDRGFDVSLDRLPYPAWELVNINNYLLPLSQEPFLLIVTSKGCPHSCLFCPAKPFYGSSLRLRDLRKVADEMCYVKERFGVREFLIWSESFTEDRQYVIALCSEIIKRRLGVSWACNSRADKVDLEMLKVMKQAGCWMIGYGIESGSQEVLDASGKGITVRQIEDALRWAKEAGLEVTGHLIFGLPQETLSSGLKTIEWLVKSDIDFAQIYSAVPWPSTPLYQIAKLKGWLLSSNWELYEQNHYILDTGSISPKEVKYLRRLAARRFYFSWRRIWRVFRKIDSFKKLYIFLKAIREFISWL